jgi:hypothetical protein
MRWGDRVMGRRGRDRWGDEEIGRSKADGKMGE